MRNRKFIYTRALALNWKANRFPNDFDGMCFSLMGAQGKKIRYGCVDDITIDNYPEFCLLHPYNAHDSSLGWNLEKYVDTQKQLRDLRQTILAFCIAMCED